MERTRPVYLELLFRPGRAATRCAARRSRGLAKLDDEDRAARAARRHPAAWTTRRTTATRASSSTSSGCSTGRDADELAGVRGRAGEAGDGRQAAGHPAARLRRPDRGRRRDRQGVGAGDEVASARLRDLVDGDAAGSATRRCGPSSTRRSSRCSAGLPAELAAGSEADRQSAGRYVRDRAARQQRTLTLAEVEVMQRRPQRRPQGQGDAEEHGPRRRRRAGPSTATRAAATATAARRTPRRTRDDPWWEVDLGGECPSSQIVVYNRTDGDLGNAAGQLHAQGARRRPQRRLPRRRSNPAPKVKADVRGRRRRRRSGSSAGRR